MSRSEKAFPADMLCNKTARIFHYEGIVDMGIYFKKIKGEMLSVVNIEQRHVTKSTWTTEKSWFCFWNQKGFLENVKMHPLRLTQQ